MYFNVFYVFLWTYAPPCLGRLSQQAPAWTLYRFCDALLQLSTGARISVTSAAAAAKCLAQLLDVSAWGGGDGILEIELLAIGPI